MNESISNETVQSPPMRLYRDVLHAVFTFIELNEFVKRVAVVSPERVEKLSLKSVEFDYAKGLQRITDHDIPPYIQECLKQIAAQGATSLRKLIVRLQTKLANEIDCPDELRTLTSLTEIELPRQFNVHQQIDLVKSLPLIRRWVPRHSRFIESVQRLADGSGPPVGLQDIGPLYRVDEPEAAQLKRLVQLSQLELHWMILPDPTQLLPFFPRLSVLTISCEVSVRLDLLVAALSECVSLTCLGLCHDQLASSHLSQFLPSLIGLAQLRLNDCENIRNLQFLHSTTAASTPALTNLQTFEITGVKSVPLKEYEHLSSLASSLEYLTIGESCGHRWSDSMISRFTPNSASFCRSEWPRLVQFTLIQNSKY